MKSKRVEAIHSNASKLFWRRIREQEEREKKENIRSGERKLEREMDSWIDNVLEKLDTELK